MVWQSILVALLYSCLVMSYTTAEDSLSFSEVAKRYLHPSCKLCLRNPQDRKNCQLCYSKSDTTPYYGITKKDPNSFGTTDTESSDSEPQVSYTKVLACMCCAEVRYDSCCSECYSGDGIDKRGFNTPYYNYERRRYTNSEPYYNPGRYYSSSPYYPMKRDLWNTSPYSRNRVPPYFPVKRGFHAPASTPYYTYDRSFDIFQDRDSISNKRRYGQGSITPYYSYDKRDLDEDTLYSEEDKRFGGFGITPYYIKRAAPSRTDFCKKCCSTKTFNVSCCLACTKNLQ